LAGLDLLDLAVHVRGADVAAEGFMRGTCRVLEGLDDGGMGLVVLGHGLFKDAGRIEDWGFFRKYIIKTLDLRIDYFMLKN